MKDFRKGNLVSFVDSENEGYRPYSIPVIVEKCKGDFILVTSGDELPNTDLWGFHINSIIYNEILAQVWSNKDIHMKQTKDSIILNDKEFRYAHQVQNEIFDKFGISIDLSGIVEVL